MVSVLRTVWIWFITAASVLSWFPTMCVLWLVDRDPLKRKTGWWFRTLAVTIVRVNPAWRVKFRGLETLNRARTYVVASNHQSLADVPIISHLPWEMKWVAKEELFKIPVAGWMLRMARDIAVDRNDRRSGARALVRAVDYLKKEMSVCFFPEGTRSTDGRVRLFNEGAFSAAIKAGVPVLPLAIEGSSDCLPKKSLLFGEPSDIRVSILSPVETTGYTKREAGALRDHVRSLIISEVARLRGRPVDEVDGGLSDVPSDASLQVNRPSRS